jgi:menaquinone-specific isochorismate synthase
MTIRTLRAPVAETVRLDEPVDLAAFAGDDGFLFEHEGRGVAGHGEAMRITAPMAELPERVATALHVVSGDEAGVGGGPVAIGALPFDRGGVGTMVIPAVTVTREADGTSWLTRVGADIERSTSATTPPDGFTLTSVRSHESWCRTVADAVADVHGGTLRKVVLAREVRVDANRVIRPSDVLGRLRALFPACRIFSVDGFVGASPELLVARHGDVVVAHPMAGTVARSGDPDADRRLAAGLLASSKEREEHQYVIDAVAEGLRPFCSRLDVPAEPSVVSFRNVSHLGTRVEGRLADPTVTALELAVALHPTPAVAGTPTDEALAYIEAVEGMDRGRYAGPVGWVDAAGNGEFAVGIRSAELSGTTARLFSGVGIVADSDPAAELAETQLKLQALLAAVVRP